MCLVTSCFPIYPASLITVVTACIGQSSASLEDRQTCRLCFCPVSVYLDGSVDVDVTFQQVFTDIKLLFK